MNADLHCHSNASDGTLSPADVAQRAKANGVELWALTDHDELAGQAAAVAAATPVAASAASTGAGGLDLDASTLPVGTRLVQLGAFDSPEIARAQWGTLSARFAPFMEGKQRIVMEAKFQRSATPTGHRLSIQAQLESSTQICSDVIAMYWCASLRNRG